MKEKVLKQSQLLNMKPASLSKRFSEHYSQKQDAAYTIQAAVVVMVRNFFSVDDFSFLAKDLIRELFMDCASELTTVRHLCIYFQAYFSEEEWKDILNSLFSSQEEFLTLTETACLHTDHIRPLLHAGSVEVAQPKNLALAFFDESGTKHRCTIKNVHRSYSTQENCDVLSILGTLTIFQKDGVRRFTQLAKSRFVTPEDDYDCTSKEDQPNLWVVNDLFQLAEAPKAPKETTQTAAATPKPLKAHDNLKGLTKEDLQNFLFAGVHINKMTKHQKNSRTATAMVEGLPVKQVRAVFQEHEEPEKILNELLLDWQKRLMKREPQEKPKPDLKSDDRLEQIKQERLAKQQQQRINKALQRMNKGKKGKKGKDGRRKKR